MGTVNNKVSAVILIIGLVGLTKGLDCYGCVYSADSEHAVLRENIGCLIGRMNDTFLFPESKWTSSRAGFVNAYGNADAIVHHMRYHYYNIPDEPNVTSCVKVTSRNPNYVLRHWTKMAPRYYANSCSRYGDDQTVCFCSYDGCNGASALRSPTALLSLIFSISALTVLRKLSFRLLGAIQ